MAKPILLLDIDGVLNALSRNDPAVWSDWQEGVAHGYLIKWSPVAVNALKTLHESGLVEIRWLTTWAHLAPLHIAPLIGMGADYVVAGSPQDPSLFYGQGWWKFHFARKIWETEQRPIIWIDDDLKYEHDAIAWVEDHHHLAISPDSAVGLTPNALELIEDFARSKAEPVDA